MVSVVPLVKNKSKLRKKQNTKIKVEKTKNIKRSTTVKVIKKVEKKNKLNTHLHAEKKKVKYVYPSKTITDDLVISCLTALQQLTAENKNKKAIFEDDTPIFMEIHCIKIQNTKGNIKFVLPHSTVASTKEVCLITPDLKKGRRFDHEPTVDKWEELLRKHDVNTVKTIIPLRQIKVEYDQYELKRKLLTQHDFIMVDTRVLSHASHLLGNMFFKKHNMLIPVRIDEKADVKKAIDVGLRTVMLRINEGETSTIMVGHTGMLQNELKENIMSIVHQLCTKYPGGEANIRSLCLKLPLSLSLPLYLTLRPSNTINAPKLVHKRPKNFMILEDEISTFPNAKVKVGPDGSVKLIKSQNSESNSEDEEILETNNKEDDEELEGNNKEKST